VRGVREFGAALIPRSPKARGRTPAGRGSCEPTLRKKREGWGTLSCGDGQGFKSAGCATRPAEIEGLADVAVEHGEDRAARAAEEGFGEDDGCSHFGVMCTRNGYGGARGFGARIGG
jgi:hypothetical protein